MAASGFGALSARANPRTPDRTKPPSLCPSKEGQVVTVYSPTPLSAASQPPAFQFPTRNIPTLLLWILVYMVAKSSFTASLSQNASGPAYRETISSKYDWFFAIWLSGTEFSQISDIPEPIINRLKTCPGSVPRCMVNPFKPAFLYSFPRATNFSQSVGILSSVTSTPGTSSFTPRPARERFVGNTIRLPFCLVSLRSLSVTTSLFSASASTSSNSVNAPPDCRFICSKRVASL